MSERNFNADQSSTISGHGSRRRKLSIEFLYADLTVCTRCRDTHENLGKCLADLSPALASAGVDVEVRKIHVRSEAQARELELSISPTIRMDGRDIQPDWGESRCEACGCLNGCGDSVNCRLWNYAGKDHLAAPREMIAESVLAALGEGPLRRLQEAPDLPETMRGLLSSIHPGEKRFSGQPAGVAVVSARCCEESAFEARCGSIRTLRIHGPGGE